MRFKLVSLLILLFSLSVVSWAQDYPVEIELVPPKGMSFSTIAIPKAKVPKAPQWTPPVKRCAVCEQRAPVGTCRCYDMLTQELAVVLLRQIKKALSETTGQVFRLRRPVKVRAVSRERLSQLGGERLLGLYEDDVIWVNHNLNRRQATAVIAHELGHAWFFQHREDVNTPNELFFEGFAEFISYLALEALGDVDSARRIAREDRSVYGRGAQRFLARYRREGLASVLDLALRGRSI